MSVLYYDCFAGISGDMHLAALLDLGVDPAVVRAELAGLSVTGYTLEVTRAKRRGIAGTQVRVTTEPQPHAHRGLREIAAILQASSLKDAVQKRAIAVFRRLAEAEARIHDTTPDRIHFHEVGALDAIVDIVGGAIALEQLQVERVLCSPVELGSGLAHCEHGALPVPAPATLELLKGAPITCGAAPFEATTPTGAALLATFVDEFVSRPHLTVSQIGYGIGHRDGPIPNVLRVCLGELPSAAEVDEWQVLECNIDDMNPECYDHVLERLLALGANDVWFTPVVMKKTRPATVLSVLCAPALEPILTECLLTETTSLGVRRYPVARTALERATTQVATRYGSVAVKLAVWRGQTLRGKPEYADCKQLALTHNVPLSVIYAAVREALLAQGIPPPVQDAAR